MSRSDSPPIAGTSDPLVTLASSTGRSAKSTTKRKTLAPLWKESFSLPADFGGPADFGAGAAASTESDASGCKLELTIFAGKDLVAKDGGMFSKATSGPFVKALIGKHELGKTEWMENNLNPEWNADLCFDTDITHLAVSCETLTLAVFDYDAMSGSDPMGVVLINIADFMDGRPVDKWFDIKPCEGCKKTKGQLHVKFSISDRRGSVAALKAIIDELEKRGWSTLSGDLKKRGLNGRGTTRELAERLAKAQADDDATKRDDKPPEEDVECELRLTVDDWDMLSGNDFMGEVRLPLRPLAHKRRVRAWFPLAPAGAPPLLRAPTGASKLGELELVLRAAYDPRLVFVPFPLLAARPHRAQRLLQ